MPVGKNRGVGSREGQELAVCHREEYGRPKPHAVRLLNKAPVEYIDGLVMDILGMIHPRARLITGIRYQRWQ